MTTKHAHADLLIGFANGRKLQFKDSHLDALERHYWHPLEPDNTEVWPWLLSTDPHERSKRFEFRLAPRTIMIGDVECEAPVLKIKSGEVVWSRKVDGSDKSHKYRVGNDEDEYLRKQGRFYSSEYACRAANNAITKLLTQQPD